MSHAWTCTCDACMAADLALLIGRRDPIAVIVAALYGPRACIDCAAHECAGAKPQAPRRVAA